MDDPITGGQVFVLIIIAMGIVGGLVSKSIRMKHGDLRTDKEIKAGVALPSSRQTELLTQENARLQGQVTRLEERLSVVERIVTDPARRIAAEIDGLR